jgi:hypothetical protein
MDALRRSHIIWGLILYTGPIFLIDGIDHSAKHKADNNYNEDGP